jgi:septal ring factor EnvC (AmiA/AmiB activator)
MEKTAKVIEMKQDEVKTEIALIKQDINTIKDNHLAHIEKDMNRIHQKVDKIDNRLWWLAGIIIAATVGPLLAGLFT